MNLLDAEPLIVARLKAQVASVNVASSASIAGSTDIAGLANALFVTPGDSAVPGEAGSGAGSAEVETWLVVAVVKLVPSPVKLDADYQAAGALLGSVFNALAGWQPGAGFKPMRYAGREEPLVMPGHAEFALRFTVHRTRTAGA